MKKYLPALLTLVINSGFLAAAECKDPTDGYLFVDSEGEAASYKHIKLFFSQKEIAERDDILESDVNFETNKAAAFLMHSGFLEPKLYENSENTLNILRITQNTYNKLLNDLENFPSHDLAFSYDRITLFSNSWDSKE